MRTLNRFDRMLISYEEDNSDEFIYLSLVPGVILSAWIFRNNLLFLGLSLLVFSLLFSIISMRINGTRNNVKTIIEKELIRSHYWYSDKFKTNMNIKITINKIDKDGKVNFTVFVTYNDSIFKNYLTGSYDKEQLTNIQIVSVECLKL